MMRVEKKAFVSKSKVKTVGFDGFSVTRCHQGKRESGILYAEKSANCNCFDGRLKTGFGIRACVDGAGRNVVAPLGVVAEQFFLWRGKDDDGADAERLCFMTREGNFYFRDEESGVFLRRGDWGAGVRLHEALDLSRNPHLLSIGKSGVYSFDKNLGWQGSSIVGLDNPVCGCVCNGRVFVGAKPYTLIYSAPFEPTEFENTIDESGRLYFSSERGEIVDFAVFENDLYVFFEYGIMRLGISGAAREFQPTGVAYSGGRIFENAIGVSGGALYFLTENGIKRFDGNTVKDSFADMEIKPKKEGQRCAFARCGDQFLLKFIDEADTERVIVLDSDGKNGYFAFENTKIDGLSFVDGKTYCQTEDDVCWVLDDVDLPTGEEYSFLTTTDFGVNGRKTLKTLKIEGEGGFLLTVKSALGAKRLEMDLTGGCDCVKVGLRGERFSLDFSLKKGAKIEKVEAEIEYV